jgi:hypothetical protein
MNINNLKENKRIMKAKMINEIMRHLTEKQQKNA